MLGCRGAVTKLVLPSWFQSDYSTSQFRHRMVTKPSVPSTSRIEIPLPAAGFLASLSPSLVCSMKTTPTGPQSRRVRVVMPYPSSHGSIIRLEWFRCGALERLLSRLLGKFEASNWPPCLPPSFPPSFLPSVPPSLPPSSPFPPSFTSPSPSPSPWPLCPRPRLRPRLRPRPRLRLRLRPRLCLALALALALALPSPSPPSPSPYHPLLPSPS